MQIRTDSGEMLKTDLTELVRKRGAVAIWPSRVWELMGKSRVTMYGDLSTVKNSSIMVNFAWGEGLY
jgi:hypothetical protein